MRNILLFVLSLVFLLPAGGSYAFSNKGEDCAKCHTLKKDEATALLKDLLPNVKVFEIRPSPVKSVWEVAVEANAKRMILYVDFSKKYIFSGQIVDIRAKEDLTAKRMSEINRVDVSKVPVGDALLLGNKDASHRIIVFTDPDCPFCVRLHEEMKKVITERKDIVFQIKMFPLPMHKEAFEKAKTIVCEKSLELLDDAYAKKKLPKPKCKTSIIDDNIKLAKKLGISGTPAMILPDGRIISGGKDAKAIKELIDKK